MIDSEVEQWQLVRLITWRSGVRFLPSLHIWKLNIMDNEASHVVRHSWHFLLSTPKLLGSSIFLFVLENEEVVCLTQNIINICALAFRWIKEIDLCKSVFELIEVSEDVIAIAK